MNRLLLVGLIVLVTGSLIAGFTVVGGPGYARLERADAIRAADLQQLHSYLECPREDTTLPLTLDDDGFCPSYPGTTLSTTDPVTDAPYEYRRLDDTSFEVCATFATNPQLGKGEYAYRSLTFEGQVGCRKGANVRGFGS